MIVGLISQKGGVGKSTICRGIAREAANSGLNVKIADLDIQQGTSVNWHRRRLKNKITPIFSVEHFRTASQCIESYSNNDLLVIDAPARASKGTLDISKVANLIIQPTGASLDDLEPAILLFNELVKNGIKKEKLFFALSRISTESEEKESRIYINLAGYNTLEGCLYEKAGYKNAQNQGFTVTETKYKSINNKADKLMESIVKGLLNG